MRKITVLAHPTAEDMQRFLQSAVRNLSGEFVRALDIDVSHIDMRAQVHRVRITEVEMDAHSICVSYEADYSIYNGCKYMDIEDSQDRFANGVRTTNGWEFDEFVPPPKRTTLEEF